MPLPKILAPLLPQSQCLQQKQHDSVLSPTLPMSPPSNNPYNNMIGLDTEETLVEIAAESATETAIILHEKPTSFDMCDNDLLIESYDEPEQQQKEFTPMPGIEANPTTATTTTTTTTTNNNNNTSYQSFGPSSSSLAISLTDSGNETVVEISPDEEIEERITPATSSMDSTTPVTPPQLMEEEHEFIGTMDQQQDFLENPFKPAISDQSVEYGATRDVEERQIKEPQKQEEQGDFTQPIQAVYTTHQNDLFDEPQEPDFMMKSNFKKSPSREGSLKSKCMKLIHGMKFHLSQERKQMKKVNHPHNYCIETYILLNV